MLNDPHSPPPPPQTHPHPHPHTHTGLSDPYIVVKYGSDTVFKSSVIKKSLNPEWNENATLSAPSTDEIIKVVCALLCYLYLYACIDGVFMDIHVVKVKLIHPRPAAILKSPHLAFLIAFDVLVGVV